jgi:hypothetical protein
VTARPITHLARLTFVVALVGCGPSPQPLPPPIDISISGLTVAEPAAGTVRLSGQAEAIVSADTLEVINITGGIIELALVPLAGDGSFSVDFEGTATDQFRLQAFSTSENTAPVDVIGSATGEVTLAPAIDCLTANLPAELVINATVAAEGAAELELTNNCAGGIAVDSAAVLTDTEWLLDNLMILPADPIPGEVLNFGIVYAPTTPRDETNVVAFRVIDPGVTETWRVFTVRGQAPQ